MGLADRTEMGYYPVYETIFRDAVERLFGFKIKFMADKLPVGPVLYRGSERAVEVRCETLSRDLGVSVAPMDLVLDVLKRMKKGDE